MALSLILAANLEWKVGSIFLCVPIFVVGGGGRGGILDGVDLYYLSWRCDCWGHHRYQGSAKVDLGSGIFTVCQNVRCEVVMRTRISQRSLSNLIGQFLVFSRSNHFAHALTVTRSSRSAQSRRTEVKRFSLLSRKLEEVLRNHSTFRKGFDLKGTSFVDLLIVSGVLQLTEAFVFSSIRDQARKDEGNFVQLIWSFALIFFFFLHHQRVW